MLGILLLWTLFLSAARASPDAESSSPTFWSGYLLPLFGYNSVDGLGLGAGGELFARPRHETHGYRLKLTVSTWLTTSLAYTSQYAQLEVRGRVPWVLRGGYQTWADLPWAGAGGEAVRVLHPDGVEGGNRVRSPYAMLAVTHPLHDGARAYLQLYAHPAWVTPAEGGLLDAAAAYGFDGASYADVGFGVEIERTDRWPVPLRGIRGELGVRGGASAAPGAGFRPVAGLHAEVVGWWDPLGERLVIGARGVADGTIGSLPLTEQSLTGGRWRDELGFEQIFAGYGRLRTRGDGVLAGAVELRPWLFEVEGPRWTVDLFLSAFAEAGWLAARGEGLGPPLPTVGIGPELLWQGASQLRPFVAWGWRTDHPGGRARPAPLFGLSVMDPL